MSARFHASSQPGLAAGLRFFLAALLLAATGASAHDFWVEPSDFTPEVGRPVGLGLWSGDQFSGSPVPRSAERMSRFALLTPSGETPVEGAEGVHPAGFLTPAAAGPHWVVYETRPRRLVLAAEKFESYLREEGLERIVELRRERSESGAAGRESYRRCAKTLFEAGGPAQSAGSAVAGCPLELVLEASPRSAAAAGEVAVRLLFGERPLAGARVAALRRGEPGPPLEGRTDEAGRVVLPLAEPAVWLLKAVHMEPAAGPAQDVDWQSWWASLTVRLPAAAAPAAP